MSNIHLHPRVVFYREGSDWIAHALEFDLVGDGPTREDAMQRLNEAIAIKVEIAAGRTEAVNLFKPADREYFAMYESGKDVAVGQLHVASHQVIFDETFAREYRDAV